MFFNLFLYKEIETSFLKDNNIYLFSKLKKNNSLVLDKELEDKNR